MTPPTDATGVHDIARFLARHPPFTGLDKETLDRLAGVVVERRVPAGEAVLVQNGPPGTCLFVLREGTMELIHDQLVVDVVTAGEVFGHPTLLTGLSPELTVRAREESTLYVIPDPPAVEVLSRAEGVTFVAATLRDRLIRAARTMRAIPDARATAVTSLLNRAPVFCDPDTPVREAARIMGAERVTAILVRTRRGLGIVTFADLGGRVLAAGASPNAPISSVMTLPVKTVRADAMAPEASLEMLEAGVNHLPVVDGRGRVVGVLSASRLMAPDELSPFGLRWSVTSSRNADQLVEAAGHLPRLFVQLLEAGLDATALTRTITLLSDSMTTRLLEFAMERAGPAPVAFAWLALGSSARSELTLASDQDNAIAYDETDDPAVDEYFRDVAEEVNQGLARCGFALDPSGVLAGDRHWRLPQSRWVSVFTSCMQVWDWEHVLWASIALDFRCVAGGLPITAALTEVLQEAPHHGGFLSALAHMASQIPTPLGFRQRLTGPIDIKKSGLLPVEGLARFYAFARGITAESTVQRLVAVQETGGQDSERARTLREAYASMSLLRLQHHAYLIREGRQPDNAVDTAHLRPLARVSLQEALREVLEAQKRLP